VARRRRVERLYLSRLRSRRVWAGAQDRRYTMSWYYTDWSWTQTLTTAAEIVVLGTSQQ
jgi:hypothetical protein